jgi:hypothetical protein
VTADLAGAGAELEHEVVRAERGELDDRPRDSLGGTGPHSSSTVEHACLRIETLGHVAEYRVADANRA